ncbi:MAG TPA: hypothetical protein DEP84_22645, partial [Chloroflexi bacterium]|nr:hypothetical protein [Chloroflexota bacterium]
GASRSVALIAAALLAVSKWHTEITRVGLRFPYAPFAVALLLIFLLRALRSNDRRDWLLSGLALGLGLYGYTAFRIAPLLVLVALALWWWRGVWRGGASARAALLDSALVPLTAAIAFLPLGHFALQHPEIFWYRSYTRAAEGLTGNPWSIFWHNVWNAALMFHWRGDVVWVNTVPRDPVLDPLTGALFLLGIGFLIVRVVRQRRPAEILLLVGLPILVLPSILALAWPGENPSVVRAGGALPVVMLIAAWPLAALARVLAESVRRPVGRGLAAVLVGGILIAAAGLNWWTYSVDYRESYDFNSWNTTEVAAVIRQWAPSIGGAEHAYVKSFPYWVDTRNVAFNLGDPDWNSVIMDIRQVKVGNGEGPEPRLIIVNLRDRTAFLTLQRLWSGGEYYRYKSRVPGKEFWVFVHPGYPRPASLNPGTLGR